MKNRVGLKSSVAVRKKPCKRCKGTGVVAGTGGRLPNYFGEYPMTIKPDTCPLCKGRKTR